jgi:agmatine/peptidylarginine deiminase
LQKELISRSLSEFEDKRRKLKEEVKRSGGVFGAVELALMEDAGDEEEVNFLLNGYQETLNSNPKILVPSYDDSAELIERKKRALLEKLL